MGRDAILRSLDFHQCCLSPPTVNHLNAYNDVEDEQVFDAFAGCLIVASAHKGLTPPEAVVGENTIASLRIGHDRGDDTLGTTNFTVELPPRLASVNVEQPSENWRVMIHKAKADPPIDSGHGMVDEYVSAVTYLGFLPNGFYQLFNLGIKMPEGTPGDKLWLKGYQDCHNQGTSVAWKMIPNETHPSPRYPARTITLIEANETSAHN